MSDLWLKFTDVDGAARRVLVDRQKFVVGRHSSSSLKIIDGRLSRQHLKIERFGNLFMASDCGSSNGSRLNGLRLEAPTALKNGDVFDLGGLQIGIEFEDAGSSGSPADRKPNADLPEPMRSNAVNAGSNAASEPFPTSVFLIAPALGILVLSAIGGLIYFTGEKRSDSSAPRHTGYAVDVSNEPPVKAGDAERAIPAPTAGKSTAGETMQTQVVNSGDAQTAAVERNGTAFLRKAAQNDAKAFLTGEQTKKVENRIRQLSGSAALAANISSARQSASQIKSLAASVNLQPQFLAAAALARLGTRRGDVVGAAREMAPTLDKLRTQIGSELADDALLMIAAYGQGEAGDFLKMRNMLQNLSNKFPDSSRSIRTVWFLEQNGKITPAEFEMAVTFLAVGAIMQNPSAFGVNAEAVTF